MSINELTIGQAKELSSFFSQSAPSTKDDFGGYIGKKVIIRTYSAGVWFGLLSEKSGNEVILKDARRMWRFQCKKSISLSGVALYGVDDEKSKIVEPISSVWLEAIEIIECTDAAIKSLEEAPHVQAE